VYFKTLLLDTWRLREDAFEMGWKCYKSPIYSKGTFYNIELVNWNRTNQKTTVRLWDPCLHFQGTLEKVAQSFNRNRSSRRLHDNNNANDDVRSSNDDDRRRRRLNNDVRRRNDVRRLNNDVRSSNDDDRSSRRRNDDRRSTRIRSTNS
jgi:hypothetical protein